MSTTPDSFQSRVEPWLLACFGETIAGDKVERNHRFLEEALELVQSCGCTQSEAHQLVDYVFSRPVGDPPQETGGVMVTLAALCRAQGLNMHEAGDVELARIWTKVEAIRAKQAAKPKHSPLPQVATQPAALGGVPHVVALLAENERWAEQANKNDDYVCAFGAACELIDRHLALFIAANQGDTRVREFVRWRQHIKTLSAAPAHDAPSAQDAPKIVAKPLEWRQDSAEQWTDDHHGFSIMYDRDDELPYSAAWGEGDAEQFASLAEAMAWCQAQIDAYFGRHATLAGGESEGEAAR